MGKMINVLIIFVLIELATTLFISCVGVGCEETTSLFDVLLNPQDWNASTLWDLVKTNAFLLGGATAIAVGTLWMKSEFLVYAGITSTFFGFGHNLYRFWQGISTLPFLASSVATASGVPSVGQMIASIFLAGIMVYVLIAMLDFARGRD